MSEDATTSKKFAKIYGIIDPITEQVVYIGKANDVRSRWRTHQSDSRTKNTPLYQWMRQRGDKGTSLKMVELASAISNDWQSLEKIVISQYRAEGNLLNVSAGGNEPAFNVETSRENAVKLNDRRKNDPLFQRVWEIKRAMGSHLKFLRRNGEDSEAYQRVVAKLKYCAQKRPDLFGCWSTL